MALGLGRQSIPGQVKKSAPVQSPAYAPHRAFAFGGVHHGRFSGSHRLEIGLARRYTPFKVLAFKTESPLAKRDASSTESLDQCSGLVRYRFVVPQYVTTFGQTLRVVGSLPELGEWNPHHAPTMTWSDGHQWSLECALPQRSFEFKITVLEGHGVKWEGGSNRVVQAEDEEGDVPVEIVVWLTCHFNATTSTQLQLAVPRASIQDAYETGKATLEFLKLRKSKLGQDTEQTVSIEQRRQQAVELARLSEAVAEQSTVVHQLSDWLGDGKQSRNSGSSGGSHSSADEENQLLLLAIDSVKVPKTLRRISFVQSWTAGAAALPSASSNGAAPDGPASEAPASSPFLRGELDSRAEDLMCAAEVLLREMKSSSDASPQASEEWASLAQEAGQVAVALEALGGGDSPTGQVTQLHLRGLASVGTALAGGSSGVPQEADAAAKPELGEVAGYGTPVLPVSLLDAVGAEAATDAGGADGAGQLAVDPTDRVGSDGTALNATIAFQDAGTRMGDAAVEAGGRVELPAAAEQGEAGLLLLADGGSAPQEAAKPEAHPLQRLASSLKGTVRVPWPSASPAWTADQPAHLPGLQPATAQQLSGGESGLFTQSSRSHQQEPGAASSKGLIGLLSDFRTFLDSLFL